jgi:hypothetical protein
MSGVEDDANGSLLCGLEFGAIQLDRGGMGDDGVMSDQIGVLERGERGGGGVST